MVPGHDGFTTFIGLSVLGRKWTIFFFNAEEDDKCVEIKPTISGWPVHSYFGISYRWKSQHNCTDCSCPARCVRANDAQCSARLPKSDPCPCSTCPRPMGCFLQVHRTLPTKSNHIKWVLGMYCREFLGIVCVCHGRLFFTLYQVRGWFWASKDPLTQSTEVLPLGLWRLRASPFKPTCPKCSNH